MKTDSKRFTEYRYWKNGEWVNREKASVSIFDHGLLYGDGCFEGLRFYRNRPFRLNRHLERLEWSARALAIQLPYPKEELRAAIIECVNRSGLESGYIRLLLTRGEGDLGLNPQNCHEPNVFIIPAELALVDDETRKRGVTLITSSIKRAVGTGLDPRIKSLNYLHSIMARMEATAAGADEAILLNQHGFVAECSAENLFIVKGETLFTPPLIDGALAGITRETILELCDKLSLGCRERSLTTYDLYTADECFICGTGARLIPVRSVDGRSIPAVAGPIFNTIVKSFDSLVADECPVNRDFIV